MTKDIWSKFYQKDKAERIQILKDAEFISLEDVQFLKNDMPLTDELADNMIENQISKYALSYGVALNFLIDGKEYVVPMAIEEPSVIAAASFAAKTVSAAGGFTTEISNRLMIGQIAIMGIDSNENAIAASKIILKHKEELLQLANDAHPSIVKRGGGARFIKTSYFKATQENCAFLNIYLTVDVQEAMGANMVNTMLEAITPRVEELAGGEALMSILSNYATECLATARCRIPTYLLTKEAFEGSEVAKRITLASQLAFADPYRATTHNKGIMNGIDAVVMATGNDWRAIEAGAHAYAARDGHYRGLGKWSIAENGDLLGELTIPLPLGSVGGSISIQPTAQFSQRLLHVQTAIDLEAIVVAVGLAQNLSAIRALVTDGIQKGHMSLQAKSLAINAGATTEEISPVVVKLKRADHMNLGTAKSILQDIRALSY